MDRRRFLTGGVAGAAALAGCTGGNRAVPARPTAARPTGIGRTPSAAGSGPGGPADLAAQAADLDGRLLRPGDADYRRDRLLYDPQFDQVHPAAIARCAHPADVATAVRFAARTGTPIAVRSGGHSYAGWSTCPGLVVDLRGMHRVRADGATLRVGAGAALVDAYAAAAAAGRAFPAGSCPTVGIGGLGLAGGLGVVMRAYGLTVDAVRELTVVTADGRVRQVGDGDLFFALRGGGAGFGVVTEFVLHSHPAPQVHLATITWPWSAAGAVVTGWQDWIGGLPEAVWSTCHLTVDGPDDPAPAVRVHSTCLDGAALLESRLEELADRVGRPATGRTVEALAWADAVRLEAGCGSGPRDRCHLSVDHAGGGLARESSAATSAVIADRLPAGAVTALVAAVTARGRSAARTGILLDALGGAVASVPAGATAFPHREAAFVLQAVAGRESGAAAAERWRDGVRARLAPVSAGGYLGYADPGLPDAARAYWGANLPRLRRVRARVDPDGLFGRLASAPG